MKSLWTLAVAAALAGPASAAVITLDSATPNGPNDFTFTYHATLGPDEGLRAGDRIIIYDFAGYIAGSVSAGGNADFTAATENLSPSGAVTPGFTDNPLLPNLVFVYTGPDFQNEGGPFPAFTFEGYNARSTFGGIVATAFFTRTTKNNPDDVPGGANTAVFTLGVVGTPTPVPEPASWAMMIGGFAMLGAAARRRTRQSGVIASRC